MARGGAELTVRPARPGDRKALVDLLALCLGEGAVPRTAAFWSWKHEDNPFGPSPVLVAEAEGRLVGLRAFLRWRWQSGATAVPAVRAVDTATHPDWRGRGLFSALTRRLLNRVAAEGTAFVFNTPNRASGAGYRKMGWQTLGRAPLLIRPLAPVSAALRLIRRGGGAVQRPEAPDLSAFTRATALSRTPFLDDLLDARLRGRQDPRYSTPVDRHYLRWRYGSPPGLEYRALWREGGSVPAAVIFHGRRRNRLREVMVTEILTPPGPEGHREAASLLRELAARVGADYLLAVASPRTAERQMLLRSGFFPLPGAGPIVAVRRLVSEGALPDPTDPASWRWSGGALELF